MKRFLTVFALSAAAVLCLAGCGKKAEVRNETSMGDTVVAAERLANGIQGYYDDQNRNGFTIENKNGILHLNLSGGKDVGLQEIRNDRGRVLLSGGMTGYLLNEDGNRYITSTSMVNGRVNTNRMGLYYYEMNLRSLSFEADQREGVSLLNPVAYGFSADGASCSDNLTGFSASSGILSASVSENGTANLDIVQKQDISGMMAIAFDLEYRPAKGNKNPAKGGTLYYVTDKTAESFSSAAKVDFRAEPGEKKTVILRVVSFDAFKELELKKLRFAFPGAAAGDKITVSNVRFGEIFTSESSDCGFEQTFHSFSDRVNNAVRVIFDKDTDRFLEFGYEYTIPKNKVKNLRFRNLGDTADRKDLSEFDGDNFSFIGFGIRGGGILGLIAEPDGMTRAAVEETGDAYVVRIYTDISGAHGRNSSVQFAHRIYTSSDFDYGRLAEEAYREQHPLTFRVLSQSFDGAGFDAAGYNPIKGTYDLRVNGIGFANAYKKENNNLYYGGEVEIQGDDLDRTVYFEVHGNNGCLESAVLLDENQMLVPVMPEVCKNFCGEFEEPYYDPSDREWGETYYPVSVKAGKTLKYSMLNIYQKWGKNNLKQISSISFHIGYYHLSTGTTESNCIAPYFVFGRDGWTLPDFRGCSGYMWSSQPQFNSVGRLRFLSYDKDDYRFESEYTGTEILSMGPVYADVEYSYKTAGGEMEYTLRHTEFPSTDENRTYYTLTARVLKNFTVKDARDNFTLFSFDGRFDFFRNMRYKNEQGEEVTVLNPNAPESEYRYYTLAKEQPFVSLYGFSGHEIENFAYIVKDYSFRIGGARWKGNLLCRCKTFSDGSLLNLMEIGLDQDTVRFRRGDTLEMTFILLPYGVPDQSTDDNVDRVMEDSLDHPWRISSVKKGKIVDDGYLCRVRAENNQAEFTVTGSRDCNAVRVDGFTELVRPKIQELVNGQWKDYVYNVFDYDGYQVSYGDGTFSYSFIVNMKDCTDERTFRISAE